MQNDLCRGYANAHSLSQFLLEIVTVLSSDRNIVISRLKSEKSLKMFEADVSGV